LLHKSYMKMRLLSVATVLLLSFLGMEAGATTYLDDMPVGVLVDAPELSAKFSSLALGKLHTVSFIPVPDSSLSHNINLSGSDYKCLFDFKTQDIKLQIGDAFEIGRCKRKINIEGKKQVLVALVELIRKGTDGSNPNDKIFYKCLLDITNNKAYTEETYLDGMSMYFNAVALKKRYNLPYAGQDRLESGSH
jgi:hypothetical protein